MARIIKYYAENGVTVIEEGLDSVIIRPSFSYNDVSDIVTIINLDNQAQDWSAESSVFRKKDGSSIGSTKDEIVKYLSENTVFSKGESVPDPSWGSIVGTLSDQTDLQSALDSKQDELVSGTNIKTVNNTSILGSGNIETASVNPTSGFLPVNDNGVFVDSVIAESNGKIGIGTTNPGEILTLSGTGQVRQKIISTDNQGARLDLHSSGGSRYSLQSLANGDFMLFDELSSHFAQRYFNGASGAWAFYTAGTEKMRINSLGKVGIGTTSPSTELHVVGAITVNDGNNNTKVGTNSGLNFTGINQSAFGYNAGLSSSGDNQTVVGYQAGQSNTATSQSAFGRDSGRLNTGLNQSAFGRESGSNNSGDNQSVLGSLAGFSNTGANQTAVGREAGRSNTGGNQSAFGVSAGQDNTGDNQSAFGLAAGLNNEGASQSAFGYYAGQGNTGVNQSAFGFYTGRNNTGANQSTFGINAGQGNTGAAQSSFGNNAGRDNTGDSQSAFGYLSGYLNTGANQSAFGVNAGRNNAGDNNSNFGYQAGYFLSDGTTVNTASSASVFIGSSTKALGVGQTNQIVIGYGATGIGANSVVLGNDSIATTALKGNVGIGTTSPGAKLDVAAVTNAVIRLTSTGNGLGADIALGSLQFYGNDASAPGAGVKSSIVAKTEASLGDDSNLIFSTSNGITNNVERMRIDGAGNVGIGTTSPSEALDVVGKIALNDGGNSVFIGENAGLNDDGSSNRNVGLGFESLMFNTTGERNTATGFYSLRENTTGSYNVANGYWSLRSNTTGNWNTANGTYSIYSNTTGNANTSNGYRSLYFNTTGNANTSNGYRSLYFNTTASNNTAIGHETLFYNTTGANNTAVGNGSLYSNTTGGSNTSVGAESLRLNTTGINNIAFGYRSLRNNTTGQYNINIGYQGLLNNTTGNNNLTIGYRSLFSNKAGNNATAIGHESQYYANDTTSVYTNTNVSVGYQSLRGSATASNNTGLNNIAIGYQSLFNNTTGANNVASGHQSLRSNTTGYNNIASGTDALYNNINGYNNIAIGREALISNTSGNNNVASGVFALNSNTTGQSNVAYGYSSLTNNTSGSNNTASGFLSGRYIADGSTANSITNNSIYLGAYTKAEANNQTNQIVIGYNATGIGSNSVVLGNDSIATTALKGNVGIGTTTPSEKLDVGGIVIAEGYKSADGSAGITQTVNTGGGNTLVIKNGIITQVI